MFDDNYAFNLPPCIKQHEYLINGKLIHWNGPVQSVTTPIGQTSINGEETYLGHYPLLTADSALEVLEAAKAAYKEGQGEWPTKHPLERISAVR